MIIATLDTGRSLSVLAALNDKKLALKAANAAAGEYKTLVLDYIGGGHSFIARKGGKLEKSIRWKSQPDGAEVYTKAKHAIYIEQGTGPHAIAPRARRKKKVVRFSGDGGFIFRKLVNHPGTPALPFFFAEFARRSERVQATAAGVIAAKLRPA